MNDEPVFTVPLNMLADVYPYGTADEWGWSCLFDCVGGSGYAGLSSQADTRDAAVAHLVEAHGLKVVTETEASTVLRKLISAVNRLTGNLDVDMDDLLEEGERLLGLPVRIRRGERR